MLFPCLKKEPQMSIKISSETLNSKDLLNDKYCIDYYQREYVWKREQIEELMDDLSRSFLKQYVPGHGPQAVESYDPYYMGEIVVSKVEGMPNSIIDGQQRLTTFTLFFIYIWRFYEDSGLKAPSKFEEMIYSDHYGVMQFNLDITERLPCMEALFNGRQYEFQKEDGSSVHNLVDRYNDISGCWNESISGEVFTTFVYWLMNKVQFTVVTTNDTDYAYVIFESMNDRGLSLTQLDMLRSFLLSKVNESDRGKAMSLIDDVISNLRKVNLSSRSKAEFEFFKIFLRSRLAVTMSQGKGMDSDFVAIGKSFHRWVRDNDVRLGLTSSEGCMKFIRSLEHYADVYIRIYNIIENRDSEHFLYLVVNEDYNFTMQPAVIMAAINECDSPDIMDEKIHLVSKYICKMLTWRVWNQRSTAQSYLETSVYDFCIKLRGQDVNELRTFLSSDPMGCDSPQSFPVLNQQNSKKIRVMLSLLTEIVARETTHSEYLLNTGNIEIEHIWADHPEQHLDECNESEFPGIRNRIGDLLVLPKSFNASYGDLSYSHKVIGYLAQNILAGTLNRDRYGNFPGLAKFMERSGLAFKPYDVFDRQAIDERSELYKQILLWNWSSL